MKSVGFGCFEQLHNYLQCPGSRGCDLGGGTAPPPCCDAGPTNDELSLGSLSYNLRVFNAEVVYDSHRSLGKPWIRKRPLESVAAPRRKPFSGCSTVTAAPGTTPPLSSITTPWTPPETRLVWALSDPQRTTTRASNAASRSGPMLGMGWLIRGWVVLRTPGWLSRWAGGSEPQPQQGTHRLSPSDGALAAQRPGASALPSTAAASPASASAEAPVSALGHAREVPLPGKNDPARRFPKTTEPTNNPPGVLAKPLSRGGLRLIREAQTGFNRRKGGRKVIPSPIRSRALCSSFQRAL